MLQRGVGSLKANRSFGVLTFQALRYRQLLDDVLFAEKIGLESARLADQAVPEERSILEAWTALSALAAGTQRTRLGTLITNVAAGQMASREKLETLVADVLPAFRK